MTPKKISKHYKLFAATVLSILKIAAFHRITNTAAVEIAVNQYASQLPDVGSESEETDG